MCKHCGDPKKPFHFTGNAAALWKLCESWSVAKYEANGGDAKVDELIASGINLRYKVRERTESDFTPLFLLYRITRRAVYLPCHTHTHAARCSLCLTLSSLSPPPSLLLHPPSLQGEYERTALMNASLRGHTAAAKAIVAADPHPDHIRMTDVR